MEIDQSCKSPKKIGGFFLDQLLALDGNVIIPECGIAGTDLGQSLIITRPDGTAPESQKVSKEVKRLHNLGYCHAFITLEKDFCIITDQFYGTQHHIKIWTLEDVRIEKGFGRVKVRAKNYSYLPQGWRTWPSYVHKFGWLRGGIAAAMEKATAFMSNEPFYVKGADRVKRFESLICNKIPADWL